MTRPISLDIGFDRKALDQPNGTGKAPLNSGFTVVGKQGNPIALARHLKRGDQVLFTLYDLTEPRISTSPVDVLSFKIEFQQARSQEEHSPAEYPAYGTFEIFQGSDSPGYSTVFGGRFPSWNVHLPTTGGVTYPTSQLVPGRAQGPAVSIDFVNKGYYFFTLLLEVGWNDLVRSYRVDPEIILSNNGTPWPLEPPGGD